MILSNKFRWPALLSLLALICIVACEEEPTTIGAGVVGSEPFVTNKADFDVFAFNKKVTAVQTNQLPLYQLGVYNDPVFGKTEARITSQIRLTALDPTFGVLRQEIEDNLDPDEPLQQLGEMNEDEKVKEVFLYIPYLTKTEAQRDSDLDGVDDFFDTEPLDPNNDNDADGVSNSQEKANGTDPLDVNSVEISATNPANNFAKQFDIDSIYGKRENFRLKVERSTYFLRDRDPNTNFEDLQQYYSTEESFFLPDFVSDVLFDGELSISNKEILINFEKDDPATEEVDETTLVESRLAPGIRVPLDPDFFQQNFIDLEGELQLLSQGNFADFMRGIQLSVTPIGEDLMLLLDMARANLTVTYTYNRVDNNETVTDTSDDKIENVEGTYIFGLIQAVNNNVAGNAVNTIINEDYPPAVLAQFGAQNASKIYLKGGEGSYAEIRLFDETFDENGNQMSEAINTIRANNWVINEANLVFYVDRAAIDIGGGALDTDEPSREPSRLYLYNTETGEPLINFATEVNANQTLFGSFLNYDGIVSRNGAGEAEKYSIKITDHINNIIVRDSANVTLGLTITSDITRLARLEARVLEQGTMIAEEKELPVVSTLSPVGTVLFGSNTDMGITGKELKLEIFYTEAN